MPLKPMTYTTILHAEPATAYAAIVAEQLKYCQAYDPTLTALTVGTQVHPEMRTKVQKQGVATTFTLTALTPATLVETTLAYSQGTIVTRFALAPAPGGTQITYAEQNQFASNRMTTNFWLVGWVYTLMYKHNLKKRMHYLEQLVAPAA